MTNKILSDFKKSIHHSLKAKEEKGYLCVSEQESKKSTIKNIYFGKGNTDDILIIRQNIEDCRPIENLFEGKTRIKSCDFIVFICKNRDLHIFFCEIKSSISKENCEKALRQIRGSKIFLEYLCQNYKEYFDKDFEISLESAKNIYIYPASNPQKKPTFASKKNGLNFEKVKVDSNGNTIQNDIYNFFRL
ncbi:MAG: hypothetical protein J1E31_06340 [Helicobacter sp.]|nr:hypothetical protein [Helicobacter sp.]